MVHKLKIWETLMVISPGVGLSKDRHWIMHSVSSDSRKRWRDSPSGVEL